MQKLKALLVTIATMSLSLTPALALAPLAAAASPSTDINNGLCGGIDLQINGGNCDNLSSNSDQIQSLIALIINIFSFVVGGASVIMIIFGGLRYTTSGGDSRKVGAAKTTIIYALFGLVVVALAQLIVHFVLGQTQSVINNGA